MPQPHPIYEEIANRLANRLDDITTPFTCAKNISEDAKAMAKALQNKGIKPWQTGTPLPLIVSNFGIMQEEDAHQALLTYGRQLKGDGLLLASLLGAESFLELNNAGLKTNHPHLPDVQEIGTILSNLKFAMPIVDRDFITLTYPSFEDLKNDMAALNVHVTGALLGPAPTKVTLEVIYLHAWRPHKSQPKPLAPGSAKVDLSEVLS